MTTLSEFTALVSDAVGRGTSLSSVIPARIAMAARWIERNKTFQYMRDWRTFTLDPAATYAHILSLAGLNIKRVELVRFRTTAADGTYEFTRPLLQTKPQDRETRPFGRPESFWLNGVNSLVFNSVPDEDLTGEMHLVLFTTWGSGDTWTHWLMDNATELLLAKTLQLITNRTRDDKLWQQYEAEVQRELLSFTQAEEDLQDTSFVPLWEPPEFTQTDTSLRSS